MANDLLLLADYRRRVADLHTEVRARGVGRAGWQHWCEARDTLYRTHAQSPVPPGHRTSFTSIPRWEYDPAFATTGQVRPAADEDAVDRLGHSGQGETSFVRVGTVDFVLAGREHSLALWWLDAYGGGLFLPFRDLTSGQQTYGGGRYLLDGAKSADLGGTEDHLLLDFNFAYHPSCVHDTRWSCPLAPPENHLAVAVTAGERLS